MHINKVHHVKTISRVANELGEDEDWLFEIAIDMEIEDGVIWVYDSSEDGEMAFTDFGVENLIDLIKIHKDDPAIRRGDPAESAWSAPACYAGWIRSIQSPSTSFGTAHGRCRAACVDRRLRGRCSGATPRT